MAMSIMRGIIGQLFSALCITTVFRALSGRTGIEPAVAGSIIGRIIVVDFLLW